MVSTGTIRAVQPYRLAVLSGVTRIPRFSYTIPPVPRPILMTGQLNGCSCGSSTMGAGMIPPDYGTLRGYAGTLGQADATGGGAYAGDPGTQIMDTSSFASDPATYLGLPSSPAGGGTAGQPGSNISSVLGTIAAGTAMIPGVGEVTAAAAFVSQIAQTLHQWIGTGRREADIIVPTQNLLVYQELGSITNQILVGQNPSLTTLLGLYKELWVLFVAFQEFVLSRRFVDRRASGQALNTLMPYADGSCGYSVPLGFTAVPSQQGCLSWGDGTIGGIGNNGMLGAVGRAIINAGGQIPPYTDIHTAANVGVPVPSITSVATSPTGAGTTPGGGVYTPYGTYGGTGTGGGYGYGTGLGISTTGLLLVAGLAFLLLRK